MNAEKAFEISESNLPSILYVRYSSIMKSIEDAAKKGRTDLSFGFKPPCKDVMDWLEQQGYWFYSIGDNFMCPKIYGVSWKKEVPKKRWYHRIFK